LKGKCQQTTRVSTWRKQGGGNWLAFFERPDGKFAVVGSELGGIYPSREAFEADDFGEKAENHFFA